MTQRVLNSDIVKTVADTPHRAKLAAIASVALATAPTLFAILALMGCGRDRDTIDPVLYRKDTVLSQSCKLTSISNRGDSVYIEFLVVNNNADTVVLSPSYVYILDRLMSVLVLPQNSLVTQIQFGREGQKRLISEEESLAFESRNQLTLLPIAPKDSITVVLRLPVTPNLMALRDSNNTLYFSTPGWFLRDVAGLVQLPILHQGTITLYQETKQKHSYIHAYETMISIDAEATIISERQLYDLEKLVSIQFNDTINLGLKNDNIPKEFF